MIIPASYLIRKMLLATAVTYVAVGSMSPLFANTELDVPLTATTLNGIPGIGTTSDVTFTNGAYTGTTFTSTNLGIGTLNDLNTTQSLFIKNVAGSTAALTLSGGVNSVSGVPRDLVFVTAGGTLTVQNNTTGALSLAMGSSGNLDVGAGGFLAIGSIISGNGVSLNKIGTGSLTLSGANTFGGTTRSAFTMSDGTLNINSTAALGNSSNNLIILKGTLNNSSAAAVTTNNYNQVWAGDFDFTGTQSLSLGTGTVTLGGNRSVSVGANTLSVGSVSGNSSLTKTGSGTLTINGGLYNTGGLVINGGSVNINATALTYGYAPVISGTGALAYTGTTGRLVLQGANTFSGDLSVNGGTLGFFNFANLGTGSTINLGSTTTGGILQYTGGFGGSFAAGETSSRTINLAGTIGGGTIDASGAGALVLTGNVTATGVGAKALTLTGTNILGNTLGGVVSDSSGGVTSLVKSGVGNWLVTGANTFSGPTTINNGSLTVSSLNSVATNPGVGTVHSASSALGAPTTAANGVIALGSTGTAGTSVGTLRYVGVGETSDRIINLAGTVGNGGTIDSSGTGALVLTSDLVATGSGAKTLTLTGTNTGANTLAGSISDVGGTTSVAKTGRGNWTLTGNNSYTGNTTVSQGHLQAVDTQGGVFQPFIGDSTLVLNLGGSFDLIGSASGTTTLNTAGGVTFSGGALNITPGAGQTAVFSAGTFSRTAGVGAVVTGGGNLVGANLPLNAGLSTITGPNLGTAAGANVAQLIFSSPPTVSGLGTSSATVLAGVIGNDTATGATGFVTYGANGVRLLNPATEQTATYAGAAATDNVRLSLTGATAITGAATQTLQLDNTSGAAQVVTNTGTGLNPSSGLLFTGSSPITLNGGTFLTTTTSTGAEAIVVSNNTAGVTIGTLLQSIASNTTGNNGGNVTIGGAGNITLSVAPMVGAAASTTGTKGFVVYNGSGTLTLPGVTGTPSGGYNGGLEVVSGTMKLSSITPSTQPQVLLVGEGATFDLNFSGTVGTGYNPSNIGGVNGTFGVITNSGPSLVKMSVSNFFPGQDLFTGSINGNLQFILGGGTVTLFGTNGFTGGLVLGGSKSLVVNSDAALGAVPGSFAAGNINFSNGGNLIASNSMTINANRGITGSSGNISFDAATNSILTVPNVISGTAGLSTGTETTFPVPGAPTAVAANGTVILSGANTYTGASAVADGILSINSIGSVGGTTPNALGLPATVAAGTISLGGTAAGTLQYTGPTATTDRVINLAGSTTGGLLDSSGTGPISFTGGVTATGAGTKSLTLTGANTGANSISGGLVDNSATNKTVLNKTGLGTWTVAGATTYTGATNVTAGTLIAGATGAMATTPSLAVSTGGTFLLSGVSGTNDRVNNVATVGLANATFGITGGGTVLEGTGASSVGGVATGTSSLGLGVLTLTGNSNVDFNSLTVGTLVFTGFTPGAFSLDIVNYSSNANLASLTSGIDGTDDRLIFNQDQTANLAAFTFNGIGAGQIALDSGFFEIVPVSAVPEPGVIGYMFAALVGLAGVRARRRKR